MKRITIAALCMILMSFSSVSAYFENADTGYIVQTDGDIYFESDCSQYTETGTFKNADFVGYDNKPVKVSSGKSGESAVFKTNVVPDYYEIYYWKSVFDEGDPNAKFDFIATGSQNGTGEIDFSSGVTGWESIGIFFCHDGAANLSVISSGEGKIPSTALRLVKRTQEEYNAYRIFVKSDDVVLMMVNSRNAIVKRQRQRIPDIAPCIKENTAFVPIRFITEGMNGDVEWNAEEKKAVIKMDNHVIEFMPGSLLYIVDGEEKTLNSAAYIENGRTMVPIRALSEGAGKKVQWEENGLIIICDKMDITESEYAVFVAAAEKMLAE